MDNIIPKALIPVVAVLMIALILSQPITYSFLSLVATGAMIVGFVAGAIMGYWVVQSQKSAELIHKQYAQDTDQYTKNMMLVYENAWLNIFIQMNDMHRMFFNNTYSYYTRWAESIASTLCNESKRNITDEDLKPVINDLSGVLRNYITRTLDMLYDIYTKSHMLAVQRRSAGLIEWIGGWWGGNVYGINADGQIFTLNEHPSSYKFEIIINGKVAGWVNAVGEKEINNDTIVEIITGNEEINVDIVVVDSDNNTIHISKFVDPTTNDVLDDFDIREFLNTVVKDIRRMYYNVRIMANTYCTVLAETGQQVPPPDVALPYDYDTLNKLDPLARMQLYQTYLYYLGQTDWDKIQKLTADKISGLPDKAVKVCGSIDVDGDGKADYDGCFIPMNIPWQHYFSVNGTSGISGYWYYWDGNKMHIIKIMYREPPENYTIVKNISEYEIVVTYDNGTKKGILIDIDRDGEFDYLVPYIVVNRIIDVKYDPGSGQYLEYDTNETSVGPKNAKDWSTMKLREAGALSEIDAWKLKLFDWWNGLDWKMKVAVVAGGAIFLLILLRAFAGTRITVVR